MPDKTSQDVQTPPWSTIGFLTLVAMTMLAFGWRRWTHPLIDYGRELYVPWRLGMGDVLYRDLAYFNGPLSPYINSVVFRIFGVGYTTLAFVNIALLAVTTSLLYRLLHRVADRFAAIAGCALFLLVFALADLTGGGNYNFVTPYSHEMTHATLLGLLVLWALDGYLQRPSRFRLVGLGALLGLVFLTKAEFFLACAAAIFCALVVETRLLREGMAGLADRMASILAGWILPPLVAWLLLSIAMPFAEATRGVLGPWLYVFTPDLGALRFYRRSLGTDQPVQHLIGMLTWSIVYLALLAPPLLTSMRSNSRSANRRWFAIGGALWIVVVLLALGPRVDWSGLARPLPVIVLVSLVFMIRAESSNSSDDGGDSDGALRIAFATYAAVLLLKILLYTRFHTYGFALAVPATMVLVAAVVCWIPTWVDRRGGYGPGFRLASIMFLTLVALVFSWQSLQVYKQKNFVFGLRAETFKTAPQYLLMQRLLQKLPQHLERGETLLVLPEGIMLNYQLRRTSPTPHLNFMPPELIMFGEDRMIADLSRTPPDVVVLIKRSTREYGFEAIGDGYGEALMQWVSSRYSIVERFEDPALAGRNFGMAYVLRSAGENTSAPPEGGALPE